MSNDPVLHPIPEEAMDAFLDGILTELKAPADPAMLTKVRAIFRKRIPLHLRSYAAAVLILRAAGVSAQRPQRGPAAQKTIGGATGAASRPQAPAQEAARKPVKRPAQEKGQPAASREEKQDASQAKAPRSQVPSVPLFVSMGKRQRLRPQELRLHISEKTGIATESLGRVRLFDNYSFIDIPEAESEKIISAVNGSTFNGRILEIKPAKKRGEASQDKDSDQQ